MWVTKRLISPVKKRIFCQKTTKFGPKLAFLVNLGQAMQAYLVPRWWVGWWLWRAGCISQDTYLLYDNCQKYCLNQNEKSCFFWWGKGSNISGGAEWQITSVPPIGLLIGLLTRVSCQPSSSPCSKGIVIERENSDLIQRIFLDKNPNQDCFCITTTVIIILILIIITKNSPRR